MASASAAGSPGGTSKAFSPSVSSSREPRVVGRDQRRSAGERLVRLVRDHALRLVRRAEDPERAARAPVLARQVLVGDPRDPLDVGRMVVQQAVELTAADNAHGDLGSEPCRLEDRLQAVERDQLADEEDAERLVGPPASVEETVLGADEAHTDTRAGNSAELGEEVRIRFGVRDHEVGLAERPAVDGRQHRGSEPALAKAPAVGDERLVQRNERVEDQRPAARDATGPRDVEVAGVADDHRVEWHPRRESQAQLGEEEANRGAPARGPVVAPTLPDPFVPLEDVHTRVAERRDHLGVTRVVPLVRPEVEDAQGLSQGLLRPVRARARRHRRVPRGGS